MSLPSGPLVAWYGDDFTGSAAVMEVLTFAGFPSVLFFDVPSEADRARFGNLRGIGIAGDARARPPAWMDENLPAIYRALRATGAPLVHYKTCSTFDSAPHVGSIGRAARIAIDQFDWSAPWVPLVVAAPAIGRWQAFGNLFAAAAHEVFRLDRHPTMSVHPVTPMDEADVTKHLARQTGRTVGLVDLRAMTADWAEGALEEAAAEHEIVSLDVVDGATLATAGRLIWQDAKQMFAVGSQGVEYALVAHWRQAGLARRTSPPRAGRVARVAAVSGSCSPVTAQQIDAAEAAGFTPIRVDATKLADAAAWQAEEDRAADAALSALSSGRDPIVFSAKGPDDPAIAAFREASRGSELNGALGEGLGRILSNVARTAKLSRVAIAGGDTSSAAARGLGLTAVTAEASLGPGAPLLRGHGPDGGLDGLELALKGGQMGAPSFFSDLKTGGQP